MSHVKFTKDHGGGGNAEIKPFIVQPINDEQPQRNQPEPKPCCRRPPFSRCFLIVVLTLIMGIVLVIVLTGGSSVVLYYLFLYSGQMELKVTNMLNYKIYKSLMNILLMLK